MEERLRIEKEIYVFKSLKFKILSRVYIDIKKFKVLFIYIYYYIVYIEYRLDFYFLKFNKNL